MMVAFEVLTKPLSIQHLVAHACLEECLYRDCAIMEAWLPFIVCRIIMYPLNITLWLKFSVHDICKFWSHCSHSKHDLHDYHGLFDECPSSHEMMVTIDRDNHIYIQRHNNNGNTKKHQSLLLREISSGPGPSSPLSCFLTCIIHGD